MRLAAAIDWPVFDAAFESLYDAGTGSPGLPTRLMVGLHMIKHMDGISDEMVRPNGRHARLAHCCIGAVARRACARSDGCAPGWDG